MAESATRDFQAACDNTDSALTSLVNYLQNVKGKPGSTTVIILATALLPAVVILALAIVVQVVKPAVRAVFWARTAAAKPLVEEAERRRLDLQEDRSIHLQHHTCMMCHNHSSDAVNLPCGHSFLCCTCADIFRQEYGSICNACREPSTLQVALTPKRRVSVLERLLTTTAPRTRTLPNTEVTAEEAASPAPGGLSPGPFEALTNLMHVQLQRERSHSRNQSLHCTACGQHRITTVFRPCGHSCLCGSCATRHTRTSCTECGMTATLEPQSHTLTCLVCLEGVDQAHLLSVGSCGHLMCTACAVEYIRAGLGNVADEVREGGLRCPLHPTGCGGMLSMDTAQQLVGAQLPPDRRQEVMPLAKSEVDRLAKFTAIAAIPPEHRVYCVNQDCGACLDAAPSKLAALDPPGRLVCSHCQVAMCAACRILWHAALTCAEVQAMATHTDSGGQGVQGALDSLMIRATSKPCPKCGTRISHYHGHACHHIRPGTGCPNCGHHFCYVCNRPYTRSSHCSCKLYCINTDIAAHIKADPYPVDTRCGCPICPDCRPNTPCAHCEGSCVVCRGLVPPGAVNQKAIDAVSNGKPVDEVAKPMSTLASSAQGHNTRCVIQ